MNVYVDSSIVNIITRKPNGGNPITEESRRIPSVQCMHVHVHILEQTSNRINTKTTPNRYILACRVANLLNFEDQENV